MAREMTIVPHSREAAELADSTYQVVRVPPKLHQSWIDIAYQLKADKVPEAVLQQTTVSMLRKWFLSVHPTRRLCGFEEFTPHEVEVLKLPIEPGFYLRVRTLSPDELRTALRLEKEEKDLSSRGEKPAPLPPGVRPEYNPRWMLEGHQGYLTELRKPNPQKYLC